MKHTDKAVAIGVIEFKDGKNENALALWPEGEQDRPLCLIAPLSNVDEIDEANAARLEAIWNASKGLSTAEAISLLNGTHDEYLKEKRD